MSLRDIISAELRRSSGLPVHERRHLERRLAAAIEGAGFAPDPLRGLDPGLRRAALNGAGIGVDFARTARRIFDWMDGLTPRQRATEMRVAQQVIDEAHR